MTDNIEKKLLEEREYFAKHPERIGYKVSLVNELKARLEQHRQTKKWIEELILEHKYCIKYHRINGHVATCLDIVLEQISGEGK